MDDLSRDQVFLGEIDVNGPALPSLLHAHFPQSVHRARRHGEDVVDGAPEKDDRLVAGETVAIGTGAAGATVAREGVRGRNGEKEKEYGK
jgi:hypothetical protein